MDGPEGARQLLDDCCNLWIPDDSSPLDVVTKNFGDMSSFARTEEIGKKSIKDVLFVIYLCEGHGIGSAESDRIRMRKLEEMVYWANETARGVAQMSKVLDPAYVMEVADNPNLVRFERVDSSDNNGYQNMLHWLLRELRHRGFRKHGTRCMRRVYNSEGYFTHAWEEAMTVESFIYKSCGREVAGGCHWKDMTSSFQAVEQAEKYLTKSDDPEFPTLNKDRQAWSFSNGIYVAPTNRFVEYESMSASPMESHMSAAKFFDKPFDPAWADGDASSWRDIPTPSLQTIFDYQEFPPEVIDWFFIMTGRMFWPVGELDGWQSVMFLKGMALAGKSTIITNLFRQLYDPEDIGVLANNIEPIFGLSQFYDKFIYVAPEIKGNLQLDQANMQSMASGESMVIVEKGKTAFSIPRWLTPGAWAGNAVPEYNDNSGSVARRFLVFAFAKMVGKNEDTQLQERLKDEVPAIICKAARAYMEAVQMHSGKGFWSIVPDYFKQTKDDLLAATSPLVSFIVDPAALVLDPYAYVQEGVFKKAFFDWCEASGMRRPKWTKDYYMGVFQQKGITVKPKEHHKYPRNVDMAPDCHGTWYMGCDVLLPSPVSNPIQ